MPTLQPAWKVASIVRSKAHRTMFLCSFSLSVVYRDCLCCGSFLFSPIFLLFIDLPSAVRACAGRNERTHEEERDHGACMVVPIDFHHLRDRWSDWVLFFLWLYCGKVRIQWGVDEQCAGFLPDSRCFNSDLSSSHRDHDVFQHSPLCRNGWNRWCLVSSPSTYDFGSYGRLGA